MPSKPAAWGWCALAGVSALGLARVLDGAAFACTAPAFAAAVLLGPPGVALLWVLQQLFGG